MVPGRHRRIRHTEFVAEIKNLDYKIAGFSVNVDAGDVIIAHMNKPDFDPAEGLSVGLLQLLRQGFVFVRLDQVDLVQVNRGH